MRVRRLYYVQSASSMQMNENQWLDEEERQSVSLPVRRSKLRLWVERVAIGLIAIFAILTPITIGFGMYLAVSDGLVINANDPFHEVRLWLIQENIGATGIGLTYTSPSSIDTLTPTTRCSHTSVTFLKWDGILRIQRNADYCLCYTRHGSQWIELSTSTCQ